MLRSFVAAVAIIGIAVCPHLARAGQSTTSGRPAAKPSPSGPVNINTASVADLEGLPGIGAKTASRIVEYRQKNGPFKKIEELMNVQGIGEKNFLKLKAQISVGAPKAEHPGSSQQ